MKPNAHLFHRGHYSVVAKTIRETYTELIEVPSVEMTMEEVVRYRLAQSQVVYDIMLRFVERFVVDNDEFAPLKFLEACSPDNDMFPFTELWDESTNSRA